ncbi:MAG: MATE family efflux transporter [bacterium]|nr:MAG: MATE family efflux transporter [bacterium]
MKDLTTGKEGKLILHFALPMLAGNVFQQLYNVVDSIVVGRAIGKEALAAVGANFPFIFALISFVVGIAIGSTVIISQYFGAKKMEQVKRAIDTLYIFMFFAAIAITVLGILFAKDIFRLIDLPADVLPEAVQYFKVYALGFIFFFGFQGTSAIMRGLGDSKTPFYFLGGSTLLNIALDLIFVLIFHWGIKGVAAATVISQAAAFFAIVFYVNHYHKFLDFHPRRMRFDKIIFRKSLKIGLPTGFQQTFVAVGFMALFRIVNMFGTSTIAAYSVAIRIDSFAAMPAMNFSAALATFVGQNIGAGKMERIRKGLTATLLMANIVAVVISVLALLFAEPLMQIFTKDAGVVEIGKHYLLIVPLFYVVFATMFSINGVMRGAGDTMVPMFISIISLWFVRIPVSWFLSLKYGAIGIWWGIPVAWFVGLTLAFTYYKTGRWKAKGVVKGGELK